ncbi:MAG: AMP-binding protein [Alphaproteobacteria bacterium]|nr:AMP-binding protein [Alphaproteobacteria bacterium]
MTQREEVVAALTAEGPFEIAHDDSAPPMRIYAHAPASLREVFLQTPAYGERPFLLYEGETLTYIEHYARAAALARTLNAQGVLKGDRVAIGMRNYPDWSVAFWACQSIGAITVSLNAWWTTQELAYALKDSGACALIVDGERLARVRPILDAINPRALIVARRGEHGAGGIAIEDACAGGGEPPDCAISPLDLATILYTSGTTGAPKGAMATHRNHVTNLFNSLLNATVGRVMAGLPTQAAPDEPQAGMLATFPFFHIGGLSGLLIGMAAGMRLGLMYKWSPPEAIAIIERHQLSSVAGVPIVVRQLLETASATGHSLDTLLGVTSGGAPVPPDLIRRIGEQFNARAAPGNGYGLTETTSAVIVNSGADYLAHPDSIGRPVPTADIRIVDDQGHDCASADIGELWVRGPNVVPGYWGNPDATEKAFGGGWFRTGDLGYRSSDGLYYVVDRLKDVIIRGGENVYCAEVEALLLEHPDVLDAAVVGVPHAAYGEEVGAVVQVSAVRAGQVREADIIAPLLERLARFKIPTQLKITTQDLPRTATGKVLKRDLRQSYFL